MSSMNQLQPSSMRDVAVTVESGMGVGCIQLAAGLEKSGGSIGASRGARYGLQSWAQRDVSVSRSH